MLLCMATLRQVCVVFVTCYLVTTSHLENSKSIDKLSAFLSMEKLHDSEEPRGLCPAVGGYGLNMMLVRHTYTQSHGYILGKSQVAMWYPDFWSEGHEFKTQAKIDVLMHYNVRKTVKKNIDRKRHV